MCREGQEMKRLLGICAIFLLSGGAGPDAPPGTPLAQLQTMIDGGEALQALPELERRATESPRNADVYNLLGFALRKLSRPKDARLAYMKALALDPAHLGALEYMGELEVETGDLAAARELEARLAAACPTGCEELSDLRAAIAAAD